MPRADIDPRDRSLGEWPKDTALVPSLATPAGVEIGPNTLVMHGAVLHVYNFRNLPQSGIRIGRDSLIGEYTVIRGQGGVTVGDRVYTSPHTQLDFIQCETMTKQGKLRQISTKRIAHAYPAQGA